MSYENSSLNFEHDGILFFVNKVQCLRNHKIQSVYVKSNVLVHSCIVDI